MGWELCVPLITTNDSPEVRWQSGSITVQMTSIDIFISWAALAEIVRTFCSSKGHCRGLAATDLELVVPLEEPSDKTSLLNMGEGSSGVHYIFDV